MRFPLVIGWQPSRRLRALALLFYAAAFSGVFLSALPSLWQLGLLSLLAVGAGLEWRQWQASAGRLTLHSLTLGEYAPGGGAVAIPVVCRRRTLWTWLITLDLQAADGSRRWRVAICEDALPRDEFRRLSVCLRAGALTPVRVE